MKRHSTICFFCFLGLLFLANTLSAQSLYQDALNLAKMMQKSKAPNKGDSLWVRLARSSPFVVAGGIVKPAPDTIVSPDITDFLLCNKGAYPDELIIYRQSAPDEILFAQTIPYDYCLLQLRKDDRDRDYLRLIAPSGETFAYFSDSALVASDIVITNRNPGNFRFYQSDEVVLDGDDLFQTAAFSNYQKPLPEEQVCIFPALAHHDTLVLKNGRQALLKVYNNPDRDKLIFRFLMDSIRLEIEGGDFVAEKHDTLEMPPGPFSLLSVNSFFTGNNTYLALIPPGRDAIILQITAGSVSYALEIAPEKTLLGSLFSETTYDPAKIPVAAIDQAIGLGEQCDVLYNQLVLYNGSNWLKTVTLNRPKSLKKMAFDPQTNNIRFTVEREISRFDYLFQNYRKQYRLDTKYGFKLLLTPRNFDYSCAYTAFLDNTLTSSEANDAALPLPPEQDFRFQVREITSDRDSSYELPFARLAKMRFQDKKLYFLTLDTLHLETQLKGMALADVSFNLDYAEYNGEPFRWYPAINPVLELFVEDGFAHVFYAPISVEEHYSVPVITEDSLSVLLGTHSQLREADLLSPHLWGDISEKYRNNPFLAKYLKNDLAGTRFDPPPGSSNGQLREAISAELDAHFAWQKVAFGNANPKSEKLVAYDELVSTYRTRIPTASDKLQVASEQFNNETQKMRRGLNGADLAAGLSDFIVERAQEELNLTFLNRLRDRIQKDSEFIVLFPQTVKMMADFKIEQYRTLLDFAKNAFVLDLRNLGVTFPRLFSMLAKYQRLQNDPKVYNLFLLYDIANKVYEGIPVENVLLHIHNRLKERRGGLEDAINKELGKKLVQDDAIRAKLSGFVRDYGTASQDLFRKAFLLNQSFRLQLSNVSLDLFQMGIDPESARQLKMLEVSSETPGAAHADEYPFVADNILGDPGYEYLKKHLEFNRFKDFFSQKPDSSRTISLGLGQAAALLSAEQTREADKFIRGMEDKISTLQAFREELERRRANTVNSLAGYLPLLKKYKALMVRKACLDLALKTELDHHRQASKHDIESLNYLSKVLAQPRDFGLYDWASLDKFGQALQQLDWKAFSLEADMTNPAALPVEAIPADGATLAATPHRLYAGYQLLSLISNDATDLEQEIENASAFLESMAATMRDHFPRIAASRTADAAEKDAQYYRRFLFSQPMTDSTLVLNYGALMQALDSTAIQPDTLTLNTTAIRQYEEQAASVIIKPVSPTGNQFLDYYDQTIPFVQVAENNGLVDAKQAGLAREVEAVRASIDDLKRISAGYHQLLDTIQRSTAAEPLKALRQAAQFDTLTGITLLWMYAFHNEAAPGDSTVIVRDTVVVHKKIIAPNGKGVEITYDSLWILPRVKGANQWMTLQQFNEVMDDTLKRRSFLGLLYQRLGAVEGGLNYDIPNLALLATKFMNTVYEIDDARAILQHKKEHNMPRGFEDYYPFIRSTVDMLNVVLETPLGAGDQPLTRRFDQLSDLPDMSNESLSLFENIFAENYGNAIRNVVQLLSITWGLREKDKKPAIKLPKKGKGETQLAFSATDRRKNEKIKSAVLTYGSFMANMVEAQTPSQVKAAISAVAVPPGSSSVKRNARVNVAVNGYFGLGGYCETLTSDSIAGNLRQGGTFGLSVPVGIAVSMGQWRIGKREQSFSLFVPVLDLGAVTSYRIDQKNVTAELPALNLSNLVSPGAYLLWNIPKSPFTIGGGFQFGPQLRKITTEGKEISSGAWRYGITCSIDVPIFNLYTQQEKAIRRQRN